MRSADMLKMVPSSGGRPSGDDEMLERIEKLEELVTDSRDRLTQIEARLSTFPEVFATRADLHREIGGQTWKLVTFVCGFGTALVAATYFIANHAK